MAAVSPARRAAFGVLLAVGRGRSHADDLLRGREVSALAAADRNLATTLVLGVLRWQIWLDQVFRPLLKRPNAKLDAEVLIALRLGAFQLLFLDRIPAHAAIDQSVELTKQAGHRFAAGMVNAVLRSVARDAPRFDAMRERAAGLAQAHPAWMVERWLRFYGPEAAQAICRHGQAQPAASLRVANAEAESEEALSELTLAGVELAPGSLLRDARTVLAGDASATDAFREGRVRVQDEGSQLIAELAACAAAHSRRVAEKILDACAAPGGKTLILAERHPLAHIVACEASAKRLVQLRARLAGLGKRVECRLADAGKLDEDASFDLALADVPCSGTGTLGRNPEIRHRLQPEDLARHAERQKAILRAAIRAVRAGGRMVYSTCSLEPEENEQVVAAVLAEMPKATQVSFAETLRSLRKAEILSARGEQTLEKCLTPEGALRLLPGASPTDGFFAALIEKTA